jgi:hypothetical protein
MGDVDYFERRIAEELAKADEASSPEVRHVHEMLVKLYRIRLQASAGGRRAA